MGYFDESLSNFAKALEFQIFKNPLWSFFYIFSVGVFMIHACLGWKKVTPVLGIPRGHIARVEILGNAIMIIMGLVYISFPLYVMATKPFSGLVLGTETPDFETIPRPFPRPFPDPSHSMFGLMNS
jgi:hypothetical protein